MWCLVGYVFWGGERDSTGGKGTILVDLYLALSDAHEWINEIPTVPIYYLAKPQPRERTWEDQRGKKTLLSLTLVSYCGGASLA